MRRSPAHGLWSRPLMWGDPRMGADGLQDASFQLPVGTVTFLLTDIEGSTRLWEGAPETMGAAIGRHYELLDEVISRHGGVRPVEQGEGDSVVAAFTRASDALAAALDAQRAFHQEAWPEGVSLKLRIALHTGEAQQRNEAIISVRRSTAAHGCARSRTVGRWCARARRMTWLVSGCPRALRWLIW